MPTKKYRVKTDKGTYDIEVQEPYTASRGQSDETVRALARRTGYVPDRAIKDELGNEVDASGKPVEDTAIRRLNRNVLPIGQAAAYPSSIGDVGNLLLPSSAGTAGTAAGTQAADFLRRVNVHPGALLDFKLTQPLKFLKDAFSVDPVKPPLPPVPKPFGGAYAPPQPTMGPSLPGGIFDNIQGGSTSSVPVDRHMPNVSGAAPGYGEAAGTSLTARGLNDLPLAQQMEHFPELASPMGRAAEPPMIVPPAAAAPAKALDPIAAGMQPRLAGKAPTLEESLIEALTGAGQAESPTTVSGAPGLETAGAGPLKQSGKFGKSGNKGQAGGYSSGNPGTPISDRRMAELLDKFGGRRSTDTQLPSASELMRSTEPVESRWHSGAEPGSAEASTAQGLHKETGVMDSRLSHLKDDPLASLLLAAILGGGTEASLMSSHGGR